MTDFISGTVILIAFATIVALITSDIMVRAMVQKINDALLEMRKINKLGDDDKRFYYVEGWNDAVNTILGEIDGYER